MTAVDDGHGSDEIAGHRAWLAERDARITAAGGCPRCGSAATTPCVGTSDDERHAGIALLFPHVQRPDTGSNVYLTLQRYALIEKRFRREAGRQGLRLEKSRARNTRANSYGTFFLVDTATDMVLHGRPHGYGLSLDEVAEHLHL